MNATVYIAGIVLQAIAAGIALLEVRRAPHKLPWLFIALSLLVIVARRAATLGEHIKAGTQLTAGEVLTLVISLSFLLGVVLISRMFRDILSKNAELEKTASELRERESLLRSVVHNTPVDFWACDRQGRCIMENPAVVRHWGSLLGKRLEDATIPQSYLDLWRESQRRAFSGESVDCEAEYEIEGQKRVFQHILAPIYDGEDICGLVGFDVDITHRKTAETELRQNQELLNSVLENAGDAIMAAGGDGTVVLWNRAAELLYGYTRQEALGQDCTFILPVRKRDAHRAMLMSAIRGALKEKPAMKAQGVGLKKDGTEFITEITSDFVKQGDAFLVVIIVRDITQRVNAEEQLRQSREKFISVFNNNPVSIVIVDRENGSFVDANAAFEKISGCTRGDLTGRSSFDSVLFPETDLLRQFIQCVVERNECSGFETLMRTRAGQARTVLLSGRLIDVEEQSCIIVSAEDVTERREMERALSRELTERCRMQAELVSNKSLLEEAQQIAHIGVWIFDVVTQKFSWSDEAYRIMGLKQGTPLGYTDFSHLVHPDDYDALAQKWAAVSGETVAMECDYRIIRPDGAVRYIHEFVIHRCGEDGSVVHSAALMQDVTEHVLSDEKLRQLSKAVEQSPALIVITDPAGDIQYVNPMFTDTTGYGYDEVIGKNPRILKSGEMPSEVYADLWRTITSGGQWRGEFHNRKKNGELYWEGANISAIRDHSGEITHFLAVKEDITERKRAEEDLKAANRDLEYAIARANEMAMQAELANMTKSEFLANMSHEIRTPMNGVIGMTALLLDSELTVEQRQYAQIVRSCGDSLLTLINEILDLSKIEAGKFDLETLDFDLRTTMEDTTELLWVKAVEKELELVCIVDPDVPVLLQGDPGRLRQMFMNLGGNAIKFTERGSVTLRAMLESETGERVTVRFTVTDTGIGIPRDKQQLIFSPFTQVDGSTTRKYGGTGLGLTISKNLAELMGGAIGLESRPGHGSTFWFTAVFTKQPSGRLTEPPPMADLKGVRVLVVDDHATNRLLVTTLLQAWGCRFAEAGDAATALERMHGAAAQGDPYRVALLDMQMPGMNGAELGRCIKKSPDVASTHLIMMTSLGQRGDAIRIKADGFEGYLNKPLRQAQLRDCMAMVLGRSQTCEGVAADLVTRHTITEARKQRVRILVVEDNATNQLVALKVLEKLGYRADAVPGGHEAINALRTVAYDVVLMDCQMPDMDGFEATRLIRSKRTGVKNNRVPVIAMTAHAMHGDREKCLEAGMDDYLSKPVEPAELAVVLERWLDDRDKAPGSSSAAKVQSSAGGDFAAAVPVFDRRMFHARLMGDEDVMKLVIEKFLEEFPGQLAQLQSCASAGDCDTAWQLGHKIKGAAANLSAESLRAIAFEIEKAGKTGDSAQVRLLVADLEHKFEELRTCFRNEELAE